MTFRVGQKVVCIDGSESPGKHWLADRPIKGEIYTVIGFNSDEFGPGLILAEIKNHGFFGFAYASRRFRPIVQRKTDISFAHDILRKTSKKEELKV